MTDLHRLMFASRCLLKKCINFGSSEGLYKNEKTVALAGDGLSK